MMVLAHNGGGGHLFEHLGAFGSDWLYIAVPLGVMGGIALLLAATSRGSDGLVVRFAAGAGRVLRVPAWAGGTLTVLLGALIIAVIGFFWDVAWHIDRGRDEFLFSPPHVCLIAGISLLAVAGAVGAFVATRTGADVGWRLRLWPHGPAGLVWPQAPAGLGYWRVPYGAAALLAGGLSAIVGFGIDELWHNAYGLDVTMWSPPHLTMISAAAFSGIAGWLIYAEARPTAGRKLVHGFLAGVTLIALSAWQLEYDLGVPQWRMVSQAVLIAGAAGFTLTAARVVVGRFGALIAVGYFLAVRLVLSALTAETWNLSEPRFPLYLGAAIAVELAFALTPRRSPLVRFAVAGLGVGTFGLAAEWVTTHLWLYQPWTAGLFPEIGLALVAAVAASVVGGAFGLVLDHQPSKIGAASVGIGIAVLALAFAITVPRTAPQGIAEIRTIAAGEGRVRVAVRTDPPVANPDRWEVMAWQGEGRVLEPLRPAADGWYETAGALPVTGSWKTVVRLSYGSAVGGAAVYMPADPEIDAKAVPLQASKHVPLISESELLQREAHDGPVWPGLIAYTFVGLAELTQIAVLIAGAFSLNRRRRLGGWTPSLTGKRVVLTGAAGGIGRAARDALERNGARVIGLNLVADRPDTLDVDVRDTEALRRAIDTAAARLGGLDAVVANAGIGLAADSTLPPDDAARRVLDVNLLGAWTTIACALPHLAPGGTVVAVTSGLATATVPYSAAYTASKRGLSGYLDVLRIESGGRWKVCEVQPGYIATPIHDQPAAAGASLDGVARKDAVDGAAEAIVAACETGRRFGTSSVVTRIELTLARAAPRLAGRVLAHRLRRVEGERGRPTFASAAQGQPAGAPLVLPDEAPARSSSTGEYR